MGIFDIFKKKRIEDVTIKLGIKKLPSSEWVVSERNALMSDLFFGFFDKLAESNGNVEVWFKRKNRVMLTASGAFCFRHTINECLLDMSVYKNVQTFTPSGITNSFTDQHTHTMYRVFDEILEPYGYCVNELLSLDLDEISIGDEKLYFAMFARSLEILHTFTYDIPCLVYISRNLALSLCECIVKCRINTPRPEIYLSDSYDKLKSSVVQCTFPLSLASFSRLRDSVPPSIRSCMHTVKFKIKKLNQGEYVSPIRRNT
tara:strand:- start:7014 stop:7790 length:777 start_codon:yes stop_codon:yes gene_type:complete